MCVRVCVCAYMRRLMCDGEIIVWGLIFNDVYDCLTTLPVLKNALILSKSVHHLPLETHT